MNVITISNYQPKDMSLITISCYELKDKKTLITLNISNNSNTPPYARTYMQIFPACYKITAAENVKINFEPTLRIQLHKKWKNFSRISFH